MKYPCPKTGLECETVELCEILGGCGPLEDVLLKQRDMARARLAEAERCGYALAMRLLQSSIVLDDEERVAQDFFLQSAGVKRVPEAKP